MSKLSKVTQRHYEFEIARDDRQRYPHCVTIVSYSLPRHEWEKFYGFSLDAVLRKAMAEIKRRERWANIYAPGNRSRPKKFRKEDA